jgi:hypothetical protein
MDDDSDIKFRTLPTPLPTRHRRDCKCDCHSNPNCKHFFPCCYDPIGPTPEDDDLAFFQHRMFLGLGLVQEFHADELKVKDNPETE